MCLRVIKEKNLRENEDLERQRKIFGERERKRQTDRKGKNGEKSLR